MPEWSAEIEADATLVGRLIEEQFELRPATLRLHDAGWDNGVWVVDERWAFRFPRRGIAIPGVERELAVLPGLAPRLPLPIPAPVFVGQPAPGFPWPFFGCAFLPGRELAAAALDDDARARLAAPLARFLRALHGPETMASVAAGGLPHDPNRRTDMPFRVAMTETRLAALEALGLVERSPAAVALLAAALDLGPPAAPALVHGDLHLRHLLVDGAGGAAGVIDWGDVCLADPCIDLPLVWCVLPPGARDRFFESYGPVSEEQRLRSRVLALCLCATLAEYAHGEGLADLERESLAGLARSLL